MNTLDQEFALINQVRRFTELGWTISQDSNMVRVVPPQSWRERYGLTERGYLAGRTLSEALRFIEGMLTGREIVVNSRSDS